MFVGQTRLLRYASRAANGTVTLITPPTETARYAAMVPDVPTAMSYIPAASRPAQDQWGGFGLVWDLSCVYTIAIAGTRADAPNLLAVFYDAWVTDADRLANPTNPPYRNTHTIQLDPGLSAVDLRTRVRAIIEATIARHDVAGRAGDMRDPNLVASQTDPTGVLNKAQPLNGSITVLTPPASSAPLYTTVPK